jgi:hypothetical protein
MSPALPFFIQMRIERVRECARAALIRPVGSLESRPALLNASTSFALPE